MRGDEETIRNHTGEPAVEASGQHENTLPFVEKVLVHMQLYGERERGGE